MAPRRKLRISDDLALPLDAVTKTFGILAQRRKGKTYTASVMAEEMCAVKQPWVALDPTGAWWGLRSSADGKSEGLPILVIGGEHGQLPLERTAGKVLADLVVDKPGHYVFDMSLFDSKAAEREFATDFAERFYRRKGKNRQPVHLFVDEADMFIPQQSPSGDKRMVGAFESIVRRGGIRGIGTTLISQRAAVVNKNVLEQIDVLVVLRVVGPNDRKAIAGYIEAYGTEEEKAALMGSLASLDLGEAWIWEPGSEPPLFDRVRIRERDTFNSSATPKAGAKRAEPRKLADVDLDTIRDKIASTIEKAKAEDPTELRKQAASLKRDVTRLEKQLAKRPTEPVEVEKEVEVPVLANGQLKDLDKSVERALEVAADFEKAFDQVRNTLNTNVESVVAELRRIGNQKPPSPRHVAASTASGRGRSTGARTPGREAGGRRSSTEPRRPAQPPPSEAHAGETTEPEQRVLDSLAWLNAVGFPTPTKIQVGFIAGYRVGKSVGGTFGKILGRLRGEGLVEYPNGCAALTAEGEQLATVPDIEQTTAGLQTAIFDRLGETERRVLQVLVDEYPEPLSKQEAGQRAGYTVGPSVGGTYGKVLGRLRSLGLIDYPGGGEVVALPVLFLEGG